MARVVCPICKTGFEARITREDYAINCVSCGIAFNAAAFLPPDDFQAISERRPAAGSVSRFDRGTRALGNVIRPAQPPTEPVYAEPVAPETRTGGLAFMYEESDAGAGALPAHARTNPSRNPGPNAAPASTPETGRAERPMCETGRTDRPTPDAGRARRPGTTSFVRLTSRELNGDNRAAAVTPPWNEPARDGAPAGAVPWDESLSDNEPVAEQAESVPTPSASVPAPPRLDAPRAIRGTAVSAAGPADGSPDAPGSVPALRQPPRSFLEASTTTARHRVAGDPRSPQRPRDAETGAAGVRLQDRTDGVRIVNGADGLREQDRADGVRVRNGADRISAEDRADALWKEVAAGTPPRFSAPVAGEEDPRSSRLRAPAVQEGKPPSLGVSSASAVKGPLRGTPTIKVNPSPATANGELPIRRRLVGGRRPPLLEGTFGPYEIEGEIARGGVGAVFRARDTATGRPVALKILLDGEDADDLDRERFRRECETAKSLALPGLVQVLAVGEVDGRPFMAMELIEGRSLDRLIPERSLSVHDSLVLMQTVAETAGALHEAGYVHRDIKPANILLDAYSAPKLADFGLVKSLDEVTRLTASGLVCGTPAYMAPEQARGDGKAIDPRSDVWALGAVLYEMLTAAPPFQADNALRLMLKITKEAPRQPRQLNPKVPRDVEAIVLKCLEKNPERRYPNGRALAADLKRFIEGQPISARSHKTVHRLLKVAQERRGIAVGVGAGVLGVVLVAVLLRLALAPAGASAETERGWEALRQQRLPDAETSFRAALKRDSRQAQAHLGLGRVIGARSVDPNARRVSDPGRFQEALSEFACAAELDAGLAAESANWMANLYRVAQRYAEEVRERERAVTLCSDNPQYHQDLALAYWNLGGPLLCETLSPGQRDCYKKALQEFGTVLALRSDFPKTAEYMKMLKERYLARPVQTVSLGTHP